MPTTLINLRKTKKCDCRIDRTTLFGNPFDHKKLGITREECVKRYRDYFHKRILTDTKFRDRIHALKGLVLGCWCVPLLCHGTVMVEYLEGVPPPPPKEKPTTEFFN